MKIYLMYIMILVLTIILFMLIKDKIKALKITGIITTSSSILLIILTIIVKIILSTTITSINISTITNYIFNKFAYTSIILFLVGLIEILLSKYIYAKKIIHE